MVSIQIPENDLDDSIEHPLYEEIEELITLAISKDLYDYECTNKVISEFRKYLLRHQVKYGKVLYT